MPNTAYNTFVIIIGFCLLGLPIIMVSLSTAPPGPMKFQSTMYFNTIAGDTQSEIFLNDTKQINGSSEDYWDYVKPLAELSHLNNITDLITEELLFMENASIDDYVGFSKLVHVFILEMTIQSALTSTETITIFTDLFGISNGTFLSYMHMPDDYRSFYYTDPTHPNATEKIDEIITNYGPTSLEYLVTVSFYADIDVNGVQMTTSFSRLILLDNMGNLLFFVSNEMPWTQSN